VFHPHPQGGRDAVITETVPKESGGVLARRETSPRPPATGIEGKGEFAVRATESFSVARRSITVKSKKFCANSGKNRHHNPCVAGSSPSSATKIIKDLAGLLNSVGTNWARIFCEIWVRIKGKGHSVSEARFRSEESRC
jgi:hypothetical protein